MASRERGHSLRVLGVDPGTVRLGWGFLEASGAVVRLVASGAIAAPAGWETARRLARIAGELERVIDAERPDCMALEASFFGKDPNALVRLGEARGMVLAIAGARELPVHDHAPARVKKSVTGHGNASKQQVARLLAALLPELGRTGAAERLDRTDAIAVAWCHVHQARVAARADAVASLLANARRGAAPIERESRNAAAIAAAVARAGRGGLATRG
jgi:crossover junction endodeoxyribonuclease RuvC